MGGTGFKVSERGMVAEWGSVHSGGSAQPKFLTRAEEVQEAVYSDAQRHAGYSAGAGGEYSEYQNPSGKGEREHHEVQHYQPPRRVDQWWYSDTGVLADTAAGINIININIHQSNDT
jgi:hypothetical protein